MADNEPTPLATMPTIPPHLIGASLREMQTMQAKWAAYNFPNGGNGTGAFLGMIEELGEMAEAIGFEPGLDRELVGTFLLMEYVGKLAHATLKRLQGIRGTEQQHRADAVDAMDMIESVLLDLDPGPNRCTRAFDDLVESGRETDVPGLVDAYGDVTIYALDVFNRKELDIQRAIETTCEQVFTRDWQRFPLDGRAA